MDFTSYFRRNRKWGITLLALAAVFTVPCLAEAAEKAPEYTPKRAVDTVWTMVGAMLVMFMQPGFALGGLGALVILIFEIFLDICANVFFVFYH